MWLGIGKDGGGEGRIGCGAGTTGGGVEIGGAGVVAGDECGGCDERSWCCRSRSSRRAASRNCCSRKSRTEDSKVSLSSGVRLCFEKKCLWIRRAEHLRMEQPE